MQEQYADGTVSNITKLVKGEELAGLAEALFTPDVKNVTLFQGTEEGRWQPLIRVRKCKQDKPKRKRKRKMAKLARRLNR